MAEEKKSQNVEVRFTEMSDGSDLYQWLLDPEISRWFPLSDEAEIEDAASRMVSFCKYRSSLTATKNGVPVGMTMLYLQPYKKLAHQCEFGIIVAPGHRGEGIGTLLLNHLIHLAKTNFNIELLHLQVYQDNPAVRLYERFGFVEFGRQAGWIKEADGSYTARMFMERYI